MSIFLKKSILKSGVLFMLVAMMAGAFAMHSPAAFAADCTGDTSTPCPITLTADEATLQFHTVTTATLAGSVVSGVNYFSFVTHVVDDRGTADGWTLQAATAGLQINGAGTSIPLAIGVGGTDHASTSSCDTTGTSGSCPASPTPVVFAGSGSGVPISGVTTFATMNPLVSSTGDYTVTTYGSFDFTGTAPGHYTTTITLSLLGSSAG